jgi:hypothetical protein
MRAAPDRQTIPDIIVIIQASLLAAQILASRDPRSASAALRIALESALNRLPQK